MEQIIQSLINEDIEQERGELIVSDEKISLEVDPFGEIESSFFVRSGNGRPIEGFVTTDEPRFRILVPRFIGIEEEIGFSFRTEGLSGGDRVEGRFFLVTDAGEATVEVEVSVRTPYPVINEDDEKSRMKNLFHFANLARNDFDAAVHLFYQKDRMKHLFRGADRKYMSIYRGLCGTDDRAKDKGLNTEEFLIAVRKKDPIEYAMDRTDILFENVTEDREEAVRITRRGWGYTWLRVIVDGDFIELTKDVIVGRDFLGNGCTLPIVIRYDAMHAGRNTGRITLKNAYTELSLTVTAVKGILSVEGRSRARIERAEKQEMERNMIRAYVDYKLGKMKTREWLVTTGGLVSKMNAAYPDDVRFTLYTAHYLITASRETEALWALDKIRTAVEETCSYGETMRAYFLYLETLVSREDKKIAAVEAIIEGMLYRHPDDWRIAWLLQFLFDDTASGNSRRMKLYYDQFARGCRSPIVYIEALDLMEKDPTVIKRADDLTLYVLTFAARHGAIPKVLVDRIVWLLSREKHGSRRIYRILTACYEMDGNAGAVEAMCSVLIKDSRTDEEAHVWYGRGVEKQCRITRLYEYYMSSLTVPHEDAEIPEIPDTVLRYFSLKCDLPFDKSALLYRYVVAHREEQSEIYQSYIPQMERFVAEQMAKGRIDPGLNVLYSHFCVLQPQDPVSAERFFEAMHMREFVVDDRSIRRIVVVYDRLRAERIFPIVDGKARIPIYSDAAAILYEDENGRRYARMREGKPMRGVSEKGMPVNTYIPVDDACSEVIPFLREGNANINLYLTEADRMQITAENVDRYRRLADSDVLVKTSRNEISRALIRFYYDNDFIRQLADYLPICHPERMSVAERADVIDMAVLSGLYTQAFDLTDRFGLSGLDEKTIYRLASRAISRGDIRTDESAVTLSYAAFRTGKYDESILTCLVSGFRGLMKECQAIYKACGSFSVETMPLAGRMLTQLMFTGERADNELKLFTDLARREGPMDVQKAYLVRRARWYIAEDIGMEGQLIERIRTMGLTGEELPGCLKLAYLKYFASRRSMTADQELVGQFLSELTDAQMGLPFLYAYRDRLPELALRDGMRFITVNSAPGNEVTIRVRKGGGDEYIPRRMKEPYPGVYTHGEVLFPGESITYFLTKREDGMEKLCGSGVISVDLSDDTETGETAYALTSRLIKAKAQNDRQQIADTLYLIYMNEFLNRKLFPLPGDA